jgi:peptidyl-dipeptidase Dcp
MTSRLLLFVFATLALSSCRKQENQSPKENQPKTTATIDKQKIKAKARKEIIPSEETGNPFLKKYTTPFGAPPFDKIKNEHFMPAFEKGMQEQNEKIAAIINNQEKPTFKNTIEALDKSGSQLQKVAAVFFALRGANTNDTIQKIAQTMGPMLAKHRDNIRLNPKLFTKIKALHDEQASLNLNKEQSNLLKEVYDDFVRGGANLNEEQKTKWREINKKMATLTLDFGNHILKETNTFELVLDKKEDLAGLPESAITGAAEAAKRNGHEGKWMFTLHKPSLIPFLQYSEKRNLREKMLKAYVARGDHDDELDNKKILSEIASLRVRKANLLGYKNFADFVLSRRMAQNSKKVYRFLNRLWKPALARAKKERDALQKMVKKDGKKFKLQAWDWWYYAEKLRKEKFDLDEAELRPYFKMENVRAGAFGLAHKLYGITFTPVENVATYHEDVEVFEVKEADGTHIGLFYTDYYPRPSKRGGAWCGGFRRQHKLNGTKITPLINNVGNFSKPTGDKPALLSFEEVTTLFHEFGHALHGLFNDTTYQGFGIYTDFVELPSQIMENWASEPAVLKSYARHYKTGEVIPDELIAKIQKSSLFNQGFSTVEYLAACFLDMEWHMLTEAKRLDAKKFEKKVLKNIGLIPEIEVRYRSPFFMHIFSGNFYAAGYYSYIWSGVLDADAFQAFKETSLFDKKTATSFRDNVLSRGGSENPMDLYKRFRGAEPKIEPLLKRRGLME